MEELNLDKGKDNAVFIKEQKAEYMGTLHRLVVLLVRRLSSSLLILLFFSVK